MMIILVLFILEAILVGAAFSSRYSDWSGVLQSGYIALDLIFLLTSILLLLGASSLIIFRDLRKKLSTLFTPILNNEKWLIGILITLILLCYEFFQDYLFLRSSLPSHQYIEARKLLLNKSPGFVLIFLGSFQILLTVLKIKWDLVKSWVKKIIGGRWTIYFLPLVLLIYLLNFAGEGFMEGAKDLSGAQTMNAPLLGIQVILLVGSAFIASRFFVWLLKKIPGLKPVLRTEVLAVLGIWILAIFSWTNSPLESNYYIDTPRAPNYELYPSSDPLKYDIQALDLLNGAGMRPNDLQNNVDFIYHPMHSLYLAGLHAISGNTYLNILFLQISFLSLIPVLLYKLGSIVHTRFSGLIVSLLYLIRERNAIFLGEHITVSHVKTLMTEPLALLVFLFFLYLLLLWMRSENQKPWLILAAGGVLGILILIRIEVLMMIPAMMIMLLFYFRKKRRIWLRGVGLAAISIMIVITPWMVRNGQVEGRLGLDKSYYIRWQFDRYREILFPNADGTEESNLPDERQVLDLASSGKNATRDFSYSDLGHDLKNQASSPAADIMNHFIHSLKQSIYYLPINHRPLFGIDTPGVLSSGVAGEPGDFRLREEILEGYVNVLPYWRYDWNGKIPARSYLPLLATLGLISYGLSRLKKDRLWIPVLLLLFLLTQSAVYAILSGSGGRYIVIVDWIPLLFYGIGLTTLMSSASLFLFGDRIIGPLEDFSVKEVTVTHSKRTWINLAVIGGVLISGLSLPLSELLIPSHYTEAALNNKLDSFINDFNIDLPLDHKKREVILYGESLYPRFFEAGDRMEDDRKGTVPDYSYQRIEFYFVGTRNGWVTLPVEDMVNYFPHGSRVIIVADIEKREFSPDGQKIHGRYFKAKAIYLLDDDQPNLSPILLECSGADCVLKPDH